MSARVVIESHVSANGPVKVAHSGAKSNAYLYRAGAGDRPSSFYEGRVGAKVPTTWAVWNVLPSWRRTLEGEAADRRWREVTS